MFSLQDHQIFEAGTVMIKSAPADFHHLTQNGDGIGLLFLPDEVVSQFDPFAKKAADFLKISRSISSRLFSFFSRRFSASKSLRVMPLSLRSCCSWRYSRTQREILEAATPSRLPTSGQLYRCSITNLIASCLNSYV